MKRFFFFCVMMAFGLATVYAQGVELYGSLGLENSLYNSSRGIIREQGIAYYEYQGHGYFVHVPTFSGSLNLVPTPSGWYIRDFHVVNGIAYFCGIDSNDHITALLGHFNVDELVAGVSNVSFHRDNGIATRMAVLNRIAVYGGKDSVAVMAIGREQHGINPDMDGADRVIYLSNYSSMTGTIFSSTKSNELFWDVVLTDNYFVTVGSFGFGSMTMRSVHIGTGMTSFLPIFSNGYSYPSSDIYLSGVRATNLNNDSIVMAVYFDKVVETITAMNLFTVDVPTAHMKYHQEHYTPIGHTGMRMLPPREMVYLPNYTALFVIDTNSFTDNKMHCLRLTPYLTPNVLTPWIYLYTSCAYYHIDCKVDYNSLTTLSGNSCIAAAGANWLKLDLLGLLPQPGYHNFCIYTFGIDSFKREVFDSVPFFYGEYKDYDRPTIVEICSVDHHDIFPCYRGPDTPITSKDIIKDIKEIIDIK